MWYGYSIEQWIGVGVYIIGLIILFITMGLFSVYLTNKYFIKTK
jgi:hypothetical protein